LPPHLPTKEVDHPWCHRAAFDRTRDARSCEEARAEPVRSIIAAAASAATPCSPCGSVAILLFGLNQLCAGCWRASEGARARKSACAEERGPLPDEAETQEPKSPCTERASPVLRIRAIRCLTGRVRSCLSSSTIQLCAQTHGCRLNSTLLNACVKQDTITC
jgi:hypothetical protein